MNKFQVALFGGSFDPVHTDHLAIAKACHDKLGFEEVWLLPAYLNPFKKSEHSTIAERLTMLKMVADKYDYLRINEYEINNRRPTYTYDTLKYLIKNYPDYEFSFIMGSDQLDHFEEWKDFAAMIKLVPFKVFLRDEKNYNQKIVEKYDLEVFTFNNRHLSSTMIRNLENLDQQIPEINDYCNFNLLYLKERLEDKMDKDRYYHCLNVGMMAKQLAEVHKLDEKKAWVAGTLHDITKQWSEKKARQYLKKYAPHLMKEPTAVWHSFTGYFHLEKDWLIKDQEILQAVFNHTVGSPTMSPLDIVVFCADKISAERNYEGVEKLRELCFSNLKAGFKEILTNQYQQVVKKNGVKKIGEMLQVTYDHFIKGEK